MEASREKISALVSYVSKDPHAEMECKVLSGQIKTKDVADRIIETIGQLTVGSAQEEHRATFSYPDGIRVVVTEPENIFKVCQTNSFRGNKLLVERKTPYFNGRERQDDTLNLPDYGIKFTLRKEEELRRDFTGSPVDPVSFVRVMHRKSWKTADGLLRIDFSLVKSRSEEKREKTMSEILRKNPLYELEVEVADRKAPVRAIVDSMIRHVNAILGSFQNSPFLLSKSDMENYRIEFGRTGMQFIQPVTMDRIHMSPDEPNTVLKGYTVTNKADGNRCFLTVARDKRVLLITPALLVTWTGLTATKDVHIGTVLDGEHLPDLNLFCIFDVYVYRGKNTTRLPLMTTDDDVMKNPLESRLGCAREFVKDLAADFVGQPTSKPMRIETKLFLAGDGLAMQEAINRMLDTKFAYPTDGLVFTPRASSVAPPPDRKGNTWLRVYKWKPADQNSIDFLLRFKPGDAYDTVLQHRVFKGMLYVSRDRKSTIVYPRETLTGEYTPPALPPDLQRIADTSGYAPSPFQPTLPPEPEAHNIMLPLDANGVPVDKTGARIEDNTIIECSYDLATSRWTVLRTRYDKTYQYRKGEAQFGNNIAVANSIWTNIHNPITEEMVRHCSTEPVTNLTVDDVYYQENLKAKDRVLKVVYSFHNRVKEQLYEKLKPGSTLLELGVGRAGDMGKWKRAKLGKVVGVDASESNLTSLGLNESAYVRYLNDRNRSSYQKLPPALFVVGDMVKPFYENDDRYINILAGREPAPTPYLEQFAGLTQFDAISCQFAIHYACESEDAFGSFTQNLVTHGKEWFFGTCMDGAAVYALLLGKKNHIFRADNQVFGEFVKEYPDGDTFTEEFGQGIRVHLESFDKPVKEYLVPFERITEVLKAVGYDLVSTSMFSEYYSKQTEITLTQEQQAFSLLHRSFVFKKVDKPAPPSPPEVVESIELPTTKDAEVAAPKPKLKRKVITVKVPAQTEPQEEPVLFYGSDESKGEFRFMSNFYVAPFEIDGVSFPTVEHYFQWSKAKLMGDEASATKMLTPPKNKTQVEPKTVKALGAKVKDFDQTKWDGAKNEIMEKAVRAKFTHPKNKELLEKLLATKNRPIGEASPRDAYWGIGTSAETSVAKNPAKWKGQNMLGKLLMALRKEFKEGGV
jgi:ribA/ribD-fused uncharacterized protein